MQLSPPPDLSSNKRLVLTALAVSAFAAAGLTWHSGNIMRSLGDPDDAMRLVLVRDLMAGRGWYDQLVLRVQPPIGVFMHWSRLLDGAIAAAIWMFELVLPPASAEAAVRFLWPMAWILPAVFGALAIARRIGGSQALFVCAIFFAANQMPFADFRPGRIDHHNVQIALAVTAAASAIAGARREFWSLISGFASGLGLAIGLEALPFHVLIGASYALGAALGRDHIRTTRNYAIVLLGSTLVFYLAETPPWRWSLSFCDAIGLNLVAAIGVAACGLFVMTAAPIQISARRRVAILAATVIAAALTYLALDTHCIHGPFGAIDTRIRPFWLDRVDEVSPIFTILKKYFDVGVALLLFSALTVASAVLVLRREAPRPRTETLLACSLVILAVPAGLAAFRMENYVLWLGFPVLASGAAFVSNRYWRGLMVPSALAAVFISPVGAGQMVALITSSAAGRPHLAVSQSPVPHCWDTAAYRSLAALPRGLVLTDVASGPFVLANTKDSVVAAPYHRIGWGILAAHDALSARASAADSKVRALKVSYVVVCAAASDKPPRGSLGDDLANGEVPGWLETLSAKSETLQIFRVRAR